MVLFLAQSGLLVPQMGEESAELLEFPLMILVCYFSSRYVVRLIADRLMGYQLLMVGVLALVYLIVVELSLVLWLRGLTIPEYVKSKCTLSGLAYVISLMLYATLPYVVCRINMRGKRINQTTGSPTV